MSNKNIDGDDLARIFGHGAKFNPAEKIETNYADLSTGEEVQVVQAEVESEENG